MILILMLIFNITNSQLLEFYPPDYNSIENNIKDKNSKYYYKKLEDRFKQGDSTITIDEGRHLYFGFVFNNDYSAYRRSNLYKELNEYLKADSLSESQLIEIIELTTKMLDYEPFNITLYNYQFISYMRQNNNEMVDKVKNKMNVILNAIFSSGDGKTCETGYHVLFVYNEYNILNILELEMDSQALSGNCDILDLKSNEYDLDEMYFDITQILINSQSRFKR